MVDRGPSLSNLQVKNLDTNEVVVATAVVNRLSTWTHVHEAAAKCVCVSSRATTSVRSSRALPAPGAPDSASMLPCPRPSHASKPGASLLCVPRLALNPARLRDSRPLARLCALARPLSCTTCTSTTHPPTCTGRSPSVSRTLRLCIARCAARRQCPRALHASGLARSSPRAASRSASAWSYRPSAGAPPARPARHEIASGLTPPPGSPPWRARPCTSVARSLSATSTAASPRRT